MEITSKGYLSLSNEMIAIAMEGKRLGLHNKSLFAVPNHLTEQTANAFRELYPNANIIVAGENDFSPQNRRDMLAKIATGDYDAVIVGHTQFDMIHLSEEREAQYIADELDELRYALTMAKAASTDKSDFSVKKIESEIKNLEAKLYKLNDKAGKDSFIEFEKLGIDKVFIDESQYYKNLATPTKLNNVAGLGSRGAGHSTQLLLKCRWLNELTNYKGVVFASGTPISNSMTEMYTLFRYLRPDILKEAGINSFDKWVSVFGDIRTELELSVQGNGSFQNRTRLSRYTNLPELMTMFKQFADIKTADTLNLPRPNCEVENIVVKPSVYQKRYVKKLGDRADIIHASKVDPRQDNMLKLTTDARKIGLDARCINPNLPDDPASKVNICINNVFNIWQETSDNRSTQLIFCDMATPQKPVNEDRYSVFRKIEGEYVEIFSETLRKDTTVKGIFDTICKNPSKAFKEAEISLQNDDIVIIRSVDAKAEMAFHHAGIVSESNIKELSGREMKIALDIDEETSWESEKKFCIYDDIKEKLIKKGVPEKEIAFIHDYDKPEDKLALYEKMNKGEVRIMLGSTAKCGAGMNAQEKMIAMHDLDVPMRPSDMGQRRGRIERQGNKNSDVKIYRYCTEGTFDAYLYQMLENKQRNISQVMTSKSPNRSCDDMDEYTLEWAETKAICSGNPLIKERVELITDIQTLNDLKASFLSDKYTMQDKYKKLPNEIEFNEKIKEKIEQDIKTLHQNSENDDFAIVLNGKPYSDRTEAAKAFKELTDSLVPHLAVSSKSIPIGKYKGFELSVNSLQATADGYEMNHKFTLKGQREYSCDANLSIDGKGSGNLIRLDNLLASIEKKELPNIEARIETDKKELQNLSKQLNATFDSQDELDSKEMRLREVDDILSTSGSINNAPNELYEMFRDIFPTALENDVTYLRTKSDSFLPLYIENLGSDNFVISHNYGLNGDMMQEPAITFRLNRESGTIDILSYEQSSLGIYEDYQDNPSKKADCEEFLTEWFDNIVEQGFEPCSREEWHKCYIEHSDDMLMAQEETYTAPTSVR